MKIAEIVATFPPYHGGMGYVCFYNARELAMRGHDVTVFTLDHRRKTYENDERIFKIVRLRSALIYGDAGMVPQLYRKLDDFDAIHLHYPFFGGSEYVYLASLLKGKRYFLTYHMDVQGSTLFKKLIEVFYGSLFMKKIIRGASLLNSPGLEYLRSTKCANIIDQEKVVTFPYAGVDVEKFQPRLKNKGLLEKHGLKNRVVVLFVGNLIAFKGLNILIDSISRLRDSNVVLLVVGGGYEEERYKKQVRDNHLEERVIFAGPKSHYEELPLYYNLSDFLVLPSLWSESFGLVVLEAMASGKPAIVSSLPGPSLLIREGIDGLIARKGDVMDLTDKIRCLARDKRRRETMGQKARKKILEKYDWKYVGEYLEKSLKYMLLMQQK